MSIPRALTYLAFVLVVEVVVVVAVVKNVAKGKKEREFSMSSIHDIEVRDERVQ